MLKKTPEKQLVVDKVKEVLEKKSRPSEEEKQIEYVIKDDSNILIDEGTATPVDVKIVDKDEDILLIEGILSEDVLDMYNQLSESKKKAFKRRGEEVALRLKTILLQVTIKAEEVFLLIKNWLKMLPKISHYFLEQEAKIKTDKVLQMKREGQKIEK